MALQTPHRPDAEGQKAVTGPASIRFKSTIAIHFEGSKPWAFCGPGLSKENGLAEVLRPRPLSLWPLFPRSRNLWGCYRC